MESHLTSTPLKFISQSDEKLDSSHTLKIISLNLLSQHVITGELPTYKHLNDPKNSKILQDIRFDLMTKFFDQEDMRDFDILHLQEFATLEVDLIYRFMRHINEKNDDRYEFLLQHKIGGSQNMKCGTIYNRKKLHLYDIEGLFCLKRDSLLQFGYYITFKAASTGKNFITVNCHLNSGAAGEDLEIRQNQIKVLFEQPFWKDSSTPIMVSGDFNHDISEIIAAFKENNPHLKYIHEGEGSKTKYNTENRVQRRFRNGQSGTSVVQRTIDGLLYLNFEQVGVMTTTEQFDELINQKGLDRVSEEIHKLKQIKDQKEFEQVDSELLKYLQSGEDIGFPSQQWFSDHIPVGAVFKLI